ncbi:MAG TPA: hypothetical protein VGG06_03460 [Thermoanaerobaculia bacterium]|jgi:hypothetical protein
MELSIRATRTVRTGLDLEASLELTAVQAAEGLREFFAPVIGPDENFDLTALFVLKGRKLRHCREQVVAADLEHREQVEALTRLLTARDGLTTLLGSKLVDLRRVCLGLYDEDELLRLGLDGAVSQDPVTVYRQGQKAWARFKKPGLELKAPPAWLVVEVKTETLVEGLGNDVQSLGDTLTEISRQRRRVQKAAAARRKAAAEFDRCYQLIGSSTEKDYRMAGLDDEADRVRPSRRQSGEVEGEETLPESGSDPDAAPPEETGDVPGTDPAAGEEPDAVPADPAPASP